MEEIWKDILGWEGLYQVSSKGQVRSLDKVKNNRTFKGKIKTLTTDKDGYQLVGLYDRPRKKLAKVHRLVGKAFIENKDDLPLINHIDEVKDNNNVSNLEWTTSQYNSEYSLAKAYKFIYEGKLVEVLNLNKFCREHNLNTARMQSISVGRRGCKSHFGYTAFKENL